MRISLPNVRAVANRFTQSLSLAMVVLVRLICLLCGLQRLLQATLVEARSHLHVALRAVTPPPREQAAACRVQRSCATSASPRRA